ncbi:MAG: cation diffusion facilitator family transporter [Candidatus Fimenecus sp.]
MSKQIQNNKERSRERIIYKTGLIGIVTNILLAGFKAAVGIFSNSIAIVLDAVNNLSDVISSVVTILGVKIAKKSPDKKHPLGHGRIEYLSAMLVSAIVIYAGVAAFAEAIKKIIHPVTPKHTVISFILISVSIVVKLFLGFYVKKKGESVGSVALIASGKDALFDAAVSVSVLISIIVLFATEKSIEAYVGLLISVFIVKSGMEMLLETLDDVLGKRAEASLTKKIKELLVEEPKVRGAYDLMVYNYGHNKNYASVHLELPDYMTVEEVDVLTRHVQEKVLKETGVILIGVGVYSYNTRNDKAAELRNLALDTVLAFDWALQLHGFYVDTIKKDMRFDVVLSFDIEQEKGIDILTKVFKEKLPEYTVKISPDIDISD